MEVLEAKKVLKEPEIQDSENNYNCCLARDVNIAGNSRSRGETDVGLLVACKIQLSSEVIRWKTETLRLQKERDLAQLRAKELDQKMTKLAERTKELEDRLMLTEDENKHLKSRSVDIDEEKAVLVQKLSQSVDKYHSYPWAETCSRFSRLQTSERQRDEEPTEDWREVSQKMLQKYKQEMRELQEMNTRFCTAETVNEEHPKEKSNMSKSNCKDEAEEEISSLLSETESLKHHMLQQRQKLQLLLTEFTGETFQDTSNIKSKVNDLNCSSVERDMQCLSVKNKTAQPRSSDCKDNVNHNKQFENLGGVYRDTKKVHSSLRSTGTTAVSQDGPNGMKNLKSNNPTLPKKYEEVRNEKVCPICQISFNSSVSQALFEEHVLNHLETESTSLLDQYVVL